MSVAELGFPLTFEIVFGDYSLADAGKVKISGTNIQLRTDTLNIATKVEERSTAKFTVVSMEPTSITGWPYVWPIIWGATDIKTYKKGEPVEIYDDNAELIWTGTIDSSEAKSISPNGGLYHMVKCIDNHYSADKRRVANSWANELAGDIVHSIIDDYLVDEEIVAGTIQDGPTLISVVSNYVQSTDVLDRLKEESGFTWWIDKYKVLYFLDRSTITAPWIVKRSDVLKGSSSLMSANPKYRNVQYLKGGTTTTTSQTLSFTGDSETRAFTMGYPLAQVPTITLNAGAQTIGIKGVDTGKDWYWSKGDSVITQDEIGTVLDSGDTLVVVYIGEFDFVTVNEDTVEIASQLALEEYGTGRVEDVEDNPKVTDLDDAQEKIIAKLDYFAVAGLVYNFKTVRSGLEVGQLAKITNSAYNLNEEEMLITSVRIMRQDKQFVYTVQAVQGPVNGSWTKFYKSMIDISQSVSREINVGDDSTLIIIAPLTGSLKVSSVLTPNVWACPVPDVGLWPDVALFPC